MRQTHQLTTTIDAPSASNPADSRSGPRAGIETVIALALILGLARKTSG